MKATEKTKEPQDQRGFADCLQEISSCFASNVESIVREQQAKVAKLEEEIKRKTEFYQETLEHVLEKERKFDEGEFGFTEKTRISTGLTEIFERSKNEVSGQLDQRI